MAAAARNRLSVATPAVCNSTFSAMLPHLPARSPRRDRRSARLIVGRLLYRFEVFAVAPRLGSNSGARVRSLDGPSHCP